MEEEIEKDTRELLLKVPDEDPIKEVLVSLLMRLEWLEERLKTPIKQGRK